MNKAPQKKVRYAVVGLGWIAQEAVLPAFQNDPASELAAIVTGDPAKAEHVGKQYALQRTWSYAEYDELLQSGSVDAVFIALPNNLHKDFTIRAARAGVHVLCEKPMADTAAECEEMIRATEEAGVKLMIAYRLHFEPGNLRAIEVLQSGEVGEPRIFHSVFTQQVEEGNVRLKKELGGGPLMDMGVYPINAARYLFQSEPGEVMALGAKKPEPRFASVHEMTSVMMRFPGDRLASLTSSFGAAPVDVYTVAGTKGSIRLKPAFDYHSGKTLQVTVGEETREEQFAHHDQFGAELAYFSRCLLEGEEPEPSGREGLADLRIVEAALESMRSGRSVQLPPFELERRPHPGQVYRLPPVQPRDVVGAQSPSGDK